MPVQNDIYSNGGCAKMKPGDRVIWLYSKKRSFATGWRVQRIPGIIVRVCKARIRVRARLAGREKVVNVVPENVISEIQGDSAQLPS